MVLSLLIALDGAGVQATAIPVLSKAQGLTGLPARASGDVITVCLSGGCDYASIQDAVDEASAGDVIKVASGVYTGVHNVPSLNTPTFEATQVVAITKAVTIRGGFTLADWETADPVANPTTVDAQGQGRVLCVAGVVTPMVEGLHITGGDATGLGGDPSGYDVGGGIYVIDAAPIIRTNQVHGNRANHGGGLYLYSSASTVSGNTIISNAAAERGGGLCLYSSPAVVSGNVVSGNVSGAWGGGLSLRVSDAATLCENTVFSNSATYGGGLYISNSDATLVGNTVASNTASVFGGGFTLQFSAATLSGNTIISNTAGEMGGGLSLDNESDATFERNVIAHNTAWAGGGLFLYASSDARLTNNAFVGNRAGLGSGLWVLDCSPRLVHTTIAGCGEGFGVYVSDLPGVPGASDVVMTNTILVEHEPAIVAAVGNSVTLNGVLWYGNTDNYAHVGNVIITNEYTGSPAFAPDGYHLTLGSAAIDRGVEAGVNEDVDGGSRPVGTGYDLGADEFPKAVTRSRLPLVMRGYGGPE
jgi:hypothetical protein